jgi:hypothetical protein
MISELTSGIEQYSQHYIELENRVTTLCWLVLRLSNPCNLCQAFPCWLLTRRIPLEELIAYKLHVGGFTRDASSGVAEPARGTFLGVVEKVQHLVDMGEGTGQRGGAHVAVAVKPVTISRVASRGTLKHWMEWIERNQLRMSTVRSRSRRLV